MSTYQYRVDRRKNNIYARFKHISISEKILTSCFLMTIGLGYLFALTNLYFVYQDRDGIPGVSVEDIMINYHGSSNQTRLGAAVKGVMAPNLKYKSDQTVILAWIENGAKESEYTDHIEPILSRDCVGCHSPAVNPNLPNLTHYAGVMEVARPGGVPLPALVRIGHIHLFGIGFILFFIGRIFLLCDIPVKLKRSVIVIPFFSLFVDIMSWFITKQIPEFAYAVVISGALMGLSMGLQIGISLFQMWVMPKPGPKAQLYKNRTNTTKADDLIKD